MKDTYVEPGKRTGPKKPFRLSKAETFFSSLPLAPKNTQTSIAVASTIIDGAVANLRATGVHPFGVAAAMGQAMLQIAEDENWSAEMREQMLGKAVDSFRPLNK